MTPGFTIIALNRVPYALLASNLAASIKAKDYSAKVALVTNLDLAGLPGGLFDETVFTTTKNPFQAKIEAYSLTPWKETFVVDADSLFLWRWQELTELYSLVEDADISFPVAERFGKGERAPVSYLSLGKIWEQAGLDDSTLYPAVWSALYYFRKSRKASAFFTAARKLYGTFTGIQTIGGRHPDEPYFSSVAAQKGYHFGELDDTIKLAEGPCNETEALNNYFFLTTPGTPTQEWKRLYNAIAIQTGKVMGVGHRWQK